MNNYSQKNQLVFGRSKVSNATTRVGSETSSKGKRTNDKGYRLMEWNELNCIGFVTNEPEHR